MYGRNAAVYGSLNVASFTRGPGHKQGHGCSIDLLSGLNYLQNAALREQRTRKPTSIYLSNTSEQPECSAGGCLPHATVAPRRVSAFEGDDILFQLKNKHACLRYK